MSGAEAIAGTRVWTARAGWLLNGDAPPLRNLRIAIEGGRVVGLEPHDGCRVDWDFGDCVVVPGWVNAHTHLEFGMLAEPTPPRSVPVPFSEWLRELIAARRTAAAEQSVETLRNERRLGVVASLAELARAGVTTVGEIARPDWPIETIAGPLDTLVFLELLGLSPSRVEPLLAAARAHVDRSSDPGSPFQAGLSPHAPYTVHPELLVGACRISRERRVPLAMHLAESGDELELLRSHSGALVETLREFDAWEPAALPRGLTPRDYLEQLAGAWRGLVVHGNFLGAEDWRRLAEMRDRLSVVYCPRTHSRFVPTPYPLAEMLAAGVRMALGTDSRATNPDLDFLAELRWVAANHPAVAPGELLRMATSDAAAALGLSDRGVVDVGRRADFAVMQPPTGPVNNPWEWLNDDRWTIRHVLYAGKPRSMFEKKRFSGAGPG